MATSSSSNLLDGYYSAQQRNAQDTWALGLQQNQAAQQAADLGYQQKLAALQDRLTQQQDVLPDKFAARGLLNSGIYNWNGAGRMGALQQFAYDKAQSQQNLNQQQGALDTQFADKANQLNTQYGDAQYGIQQTEALDQSRQAISDALAGA